MNTPPTTTVVESQPAEIKAKGRSKKPRTEAQENATKKMLEKLKEKRKKVDEDDSDDAPDPPKAVIEIPKVEEPPKAVVEPPKEDVKPVLDMSKEGIKANLKKLKKEKEALTKLIMEDDEPKKKPKKKTDQYATKDDLRYLLEEITSSVNPEFESVRNKLNSMKPQVVEKVIERIVVEKPVVNISQSLPEKPVLKGKELLDQFLFKRV